VNDQGYLVVHVIPRSQKALVTKEQDGSFKVKVKSAPKNGRANQELLEVLGEFLGVPKGALEIVSGKGSRKKLVRLVR
jgi:uncharacterized protein (TIGR00251 family)